MNYLALLNNVHVAIENADEINYSWATEFPSPNPTFSFDNFIELVGTNDNQNGYAVYKQFITQFGAYNAIPFSYTDLYTGDKLFEGFGLPYSNQTFEDLQRFKVQLEIVESNIINTLNSLSLSTFTNEEIEYKKVRLILQNKTWNELQTDLAFISIVIMYFEIGMALLQLASLASVLDPVQLALGIALAALQLTSLIFALVDLINSLKPNTRKVNCVLVKDVFTVACNKLGITFKSSIFEGVYSKLAFISKTDYEGTQQNTPINSPLPKMTFLEFVDKIGAMFNARAKLFGNTLVFERVDYFWSYINPLNNLPSNFVLNSLQDNGRFTRNKEDMFAQLKLGFATDDSELNTKQRSIAENPHPNTLIVSFKLKDDKVLDKKNQVFEGVNDIEIQFARAVRKENTTFAEDLYGTINDIFATVVNIISFGFIDIEPSPDLTGYMQVSDYTIGVDKVFLYENERVHKDNAKYVNAKYLYDNFHAISNPINNQWIKYQDVAISTEQSRFVARLKQWNVALDKDRREIVVTKFDMDLETQTYTLEYRYKETYVPANVIEVKEITQ